MCLIILVHLFSLLPKFQTGLMGFGFFSPQLPAVSVGFSVLLMFFKNKTKQSSKALNEI